MIVEGSKVAARAHTRAHSMERVWQTRKQMVGLVL
jgi:hypothetical protein